MLTKQEAMKEMAVKINAAKTLISEAEKIAIAQGWDVQDWYEHSDCEDEEEGTYNDALYQLQKWNSSAC